ncbi:ATP-binding protein [Prevotella sp. P2-180]|uniref:ATP-binding protein n=1 Tax=Prevotella sp. P2-180 TaxID=2024224 RepID=UPI000B971AF6|nr:ATP-binding protein [Prevotella sp. P2-180]OYP65839.1 ATP/GTP-binding protein [Prevotella sp. P2-180]
MFRRKIEQVLLDWKKNKDKMPIVIKGCRQCGKTFSVLDFARKNYGNVVYLDFFLNPQYKSIFDDSLEIDNILVNISTLLPNVRIVPGDTCFVFDEIQDCPRARTSLKFFKIDGRFDVICTGSLLGVSGYRSQDTDDDRFAPVPVGYEKIVEMYPMDFEEWLWTNGIQEAVFRKLEDCLSSLVPVPEVIHRRMTQLLQQYVIVGGMPRAVTTFMETHNIQEVVSVQNAIIEGYKTDMLKYAPQPDKSRIRECFESIPKQLSRENKKFAYAQVRANGRGRDYQGSLQWIEDAGIIRKCYNLEIPELPLDGNAISEQFKVYMADTGLFISMLERETAHDILNGNLFGYKGAIFENLIADIFGKMGRKLYYYRKDSGLEVDFVMRYDGECTLVEVKASSGNVKSTKTILAHPERYHVSRAIKLGNYNIGTSDQITTLPLYMAFLLK